MTATFVLCTLGAGIALPLAAVGIIYVLPVTPFPAWLLIFVSLGPVPVGVAIPSLLLWLWHPQLFAGDGEVPPRSFYGLITFSLVSLAWYAFVLPEGIRAQGSTVSLSLLAINVVSICALHAVMHVARRRENFFVTLALYFLSGVWVLTVAFPAFGPVGN